MQERLQRVWNPSLGGRVSVGGAMGGGGTSSKGRSMNGSVWLERRVPGWSRGENDLGNV